MLALWLFIKVARATPSSADIELVTPMFGERSVPGADAAFGGYLNRFRAGTMVMYELDPLIYRQGGVQAGTAVANRFTTNLGVSWDPTPELTTHLYFPFAGQWGADSIDAANGVGAGDLDFGARLALLQGDVAGFAIAGDVRFPTSAADQWLGERSVRAVVGANFSLAVGPVDVLTGAGINGRRKVDTEDDFVLGTEFQGDAALNVHILPDTLSVYAAGVGRTGLAAESGAEGQPIEGLLGAQWTPNAHWQVDLGFGHGLTSGYGTSRFRMLAGLTFVIEPPPPPPKVEPDVYFPPVPEPPPEKPPEPPPCTPVPEPPKPEPKPDWNEGQLAKVVADRIEIRDPIEFVLGTADIRDASRPVLAAVAQTLREHPEILEVVIEGHASDEGPFEANYELSMARASAVYRQLVEAGIDAQRLSVRALGEVAPRSTNAAENRRVEFHITEQADPGGPPATAPNTPVPWTGERLNP